jgi:hypothetical protein
MKTIVPIEIVNLGDKSSHHLFVKGSINGKTYDLLLDTGASQTVFDLLLVPEMKKKAGQPEIQSAGINVGELKTSFGSILKFKLGALRLKDWQVVRIDLSHVNETYKRFSSKQVAGLIGSDFLLRHQAIINYKKKHLVLRS